MCGGRAVFVLCCAYLPVELAVVDHGQHTEGLDLQPITNTSSHNTSMSHCLSLPVLSASSSDPVGSFSHL